MTTKTPSHAVVQADLHAMSHDFGVAGGADWDARWRQKLAQYFAQFRSDDIQFSLIQQRRFKLRYPHSVAAGSKLRRLMRQGKRQHSLAKLLRFYGHN